MIRAAILDIDGTLLDSNDSHARAWVDALKESGYDVPYEKIRSLIGMGGDQLLPRITPLDSESALGKKLGKRQVEIFRDNYLAHCSPFPAARDLLQHFKKEGLKLVVASSADATLSDALLERANVADLIDEKTKRQEGENSKPSPDLIEQALQIAGVSADEAVMLGDTPYDIEAANRAGVKTIALTCGGWQPHDLRRAAAIHRDPRDLLSQLERQNQHGETFVDALG